VYSELKTFTLDENVVILNNESLIYGKTKIKIE